LTSNGGNATIATICDGGTTEAPMSAPEERREMTLRMEASEYDALRAYAATTSTSINKVVVAAIREFLSGPAREQQFEAALARVRDEYRVALDKLGQI
jgi:hypothetical protein